MNAQGNMGAADALGVVASGFGGTGSCVEYSSSGTVINCADGGSQSTSGCASDGGSNTGSDCLELLAGRRLDLCGGIVSGC